VNTPELAVGQWTHDDAVVVVPSGRLDVYTYPQLRDVLLKSAAEAPAALVIDLFDLSVDRISTLSLFPTVWMRTTVWPGVPLLLAGAGAELALMLARSAVPRFLPCHPTVVGALNAIGAPPPRRRAEIELPPTVGSSRVARAWVAEQLQRFGVSGCEAAILVATELVENSVQHAGTPLRLRLELHCAGLSVAVADGDPTRPVISRHGTVGTRFGMALVEVFARAWGHSPRAAGGKVVWAVLAVPGGPGGPLQPGHASVPLS